MAIISKSVKEDFVRGADTGWARAHMFFKNGVRAVAVFLAVWLALACTIFYFRTDEFQREAIYANRVSAALSAFFLASTSVNFSAMGENGEVIDRSAPARVMRIATQKYWESGKTQILFSLVASFWSGAIAVFLLVTAQIRRGRRIAKDTFLRGGRIVEAKALAKEIPNPSIFKLGNVPIPENRLTRNVALFGAQGAGKSQALMHIMDAARANDLPCLVYDKTGEFTEFYYREGIDYILNPVDLRCAAWSIFSDLRSDFDFSMLSSFFVPENKKSSDPMWDNAARILLEDVIRIVASGKAGPRTMRQVQEILTKSTLVELSDLLRAHGATSSGTITPSNERGSESIRLTLNASPAIRYFHYLQPPAAGVPTFSVRDWVARRDGSWLFLPSGADIHEVTRPFISLWLELALMGAMVLRPIRGERVGVNMMFFLDELASLAKMQGLKTALTESSKFQICSIVGLQSSAQGSEIYGDEAWQVAMGNLQNKLVLRIEDYKTAQEYSKLLGEEEIEEVNEGNSFGTEAARDGVNLATKRGKKDLVMPTEITTLPDLTGFVKLAGDLPVARNVAITPITRKVQAKAYIPRPGLEVVIPDDEPAPEVVSAPVAEPEISLSDEIEAWAHDEPSPEAEPDARILFEPTSEAPPAQRTKVFDVDLPSTRCGVKKIGGGWK